MSLSAVLSRANAQSFFNFGLNGDAERGDWPVIQALRPQIRTVVTAAFTKRGRSGTKNCGLPDV